MSVTTQRQPGGVRDVIVMKYYCGVMAAEWAAKREKMIGDTGLDSLLPGILLEAESDLDTREEPDERPSKILKIKSEFDLESAIKTELPDSCTDLYLMVGIIILKYKRTSLSKATNETEGADERQMPKFFAN